MSLRTYTHAHTYVAIRMYLGGFKIFPSTYIQHQINAYKLHAQVIILYTYVTNLAIARVLVQ